MKRNYWKRKINKRNLVIEHMKLDLLVEQKYLQQ